MSAKINVLLIEDRYDDVAISLESLHRSSPSSLDIHLDHVTTVDDARKHLEDDHHHLILCDLGLAKTTGMATFAEVNEICKNLPIVVLSATSGLDDAVACIAQGAADFVRKDDLLGDDLFRSIIFALLRNSEALSKSLIEALSTSAKSLTS